MRIHSNKPPASIYLCVDCLFLNDDSYNIDKCSHCGGDDWIEYEKVEYED